MPPLAAAPQRLESDRQCREITERGSVPASNGDWVREERRAQERFFSGAFFSHVSDSVPRAQPARRSKRLFRPSATQANEGKTSPARR